MHRTTSGFDGNTKPREWRTGRALVDREYQPLDDFSPMYFGSRRAHYSPRKDELVISRQINLTSQTRMVILTTGQPVVLAFYPADWSPVCGDEMALFNEVLPENVYAAGSRTSRTTVMFEGIPRF
jgi:hypothetical protein